MCGIIGAISTEPVMPILLQGLERMEYRGYDSAGVVVIDEKDQLQRVRVKGKVKDLIDRVNTQIEVFQKSQIGLAHTRWATHGKPSEINAHPHLSGKTDTIAIVHNGIIENYVELKEKLKNKGYVFLSDTDTEVAAHLIFDYQKTAPSLLHAVQAAVAELKGSFALGVLSLKYPDQLIAVCGGAPVVIGLGSDANYFASDYLALMSLTERFMYLAPGDIACINRQPGQSGVQIFDENNQPIQHEIKIISSQNIARAERGAYAHYMQKEIFEQAIAITDTLAGRLSETEVLSVIEGSGQNKLHAMLSQIDTVHIIACGTSYHAGLVARGWIETIARIPCMVEIASEYRYRHINVRANTLFIAISQSGETADTLAALRKAKQSGYSGILAICNVLESTIVREADGVLLTRAGPEIGVASTKAFTTQLSVLALLVILLTRNNLIKDNLIENNNNNLIENNNQQLEFTWVQALRALPHAMENLLLLDKKIQALAPLFKDKQHALFLGRGIYYFIAMEGALKLKEISYIHAEAYPAGELKHGPLSLVDENMPVIVLAPPDELFEKLMSNIQEVKARGGELFIFTHGDAWEKHCPVGGLPAHIVHMDISLADPFTIPILYSLPMQLLAYHVAVLRGANVDQPRNLAKSVTVE